MPCINILCTARKSTAVFACQTLLLLAHAAVLSCYAQPIIPVSGAALPLPNIPLLHSETATAYPAVPLSYVRSWNVQLPVTDPNAVLSLSAIQEVSITTQYLDGLGRPLQTVSRGVTPHGYDLVAPMVYDGAGREAYHYHAYASASNDGSCKLIPLADEQTFLQRLYPGE